MNELFTSEGKGTVKARDREPRTGGATFGRAPRFVLRSAVARLWIVGASAICVGSLALVLPGTCQAQEVPPPGSVHYQWTGQTPPGVVGTWQLRRGVGPAGYFQPVQIVGPKGLRVDFEPAVGNIHPSPGEWGSKKGATAAPALAGLLVGPAYRIQLSGLPDHPNRSLWPTIEVIDRLYPPVGSEPKFPIPIEFTQEEIDAALEGRMITKVIYLEEPDRALPLERVAGRLPVFDVAPGRDPLKAADVFGRPMAIVRLGKRVPLAYPSAAYASPPVLFPLEPDIRGPSPASKVPQVNQAGASPAGWVSPPPLPAASARRGQAKEQP